jgi:hypothetical protein
MRRLPAVSSSWRLCNCIHPFVSCIGYASVTLHSTYLLVCAGLANDVQQPVQHLRGHQHLACHLPLSSASRQARQHTQPRQLQRLFKLNDSSSSSSTSRRHADNRNSI